MRTRSKVLAVLALAVGVAACQSVQTTAGGTVGVDRAQRMSPLVSEAQLRQGAVQAYTQLIGKERQEGDLNADPALTARVRGIMQRLVAQTGAFRPDAPGWAWEVNVIRSPELNAWCMPGGKMAVYSGIIEKLALTDDELAAIMGHEIAHALREHGRERASEQQGAGLLAAGVAIVTGQRVAADLASLAYQVTTGLPNSRTHETEADRIGVELAARGGYDPRAAIALWQKMNRATGGGGGQPAWLSTHPSPESRIKDLETYSARVLPLYEAARRR